MRVKPRFWITLRILSTVLSLLSVAGAFYAYQQVRETRREIQAEGTLLHLNDITAAVVTTQTDAKDPQFGLYSKEMKLVYADGSFFVTNDRRIITHVLSKIAPGKTEYHMEKL